MRIEKHTDTAVRRIKSIVGFSIAKKFQIFTLLFIFLIVLAFVVWFVHTQQTIFYWDTSAYWIKSTGLKDWFHNTPKEAVLGVIHSIRHDEYNLLFATPFILISGTSRLTYILSIYFIFFIPATLLLAAICHRFTGNIWPSYVTSSWRFVIIWGTIVCNPFIILPILGGYPDIVGLIPISVALLLYIRTRKNPLIRTLITMGVLLLIATLLRRWYVFEAVGIIIAIAMDQVILLKLWKFNKKTVYSFLKLVALPVTYIGLFYAVAADYLKELLSKDYSNIYAAYKFHDSYHQLGGIIVQHYGLFLFLIAAIGICGAIYRDERNRQLLIVILASQVFSFFAVGRVQTFDTHQYYLLTIGMLIGIAAFPYVIVTAKKIITFVLFFILSATLFVSSVTMYHHPEWAGILFTDVDSKPERRSDIRTLEQMYLDVSTASAATRQSDSIYVLACSFVMNVDLFKNIPLSTDAAIPIINEKKYTPSAIFDVAQGFDKSFFSSDFIIDSNPIGYITTKHDEQKVVTLLHNELKPGGILYPYYSTLKTYQIEDGYTVTTLQRKAEIPAGVQSLLISKIASTHSTTVPVVD